MKNSVFVLAIFCFSINGFSQKKPKNIILMIGDGMGVTQVYAGITANGNKLELERCKHIGFSKTWSADDYITDSGAGATALSIGKKAKNGAIGVDEHDKPHETILETASRKGLKTGLVATSTIVHATPASFIAHVPNRNMYEAIAADFLKTDIDVFIGGGRKYFRKREDGRDLIKELQTKKYQIANSLEEIMLISSGKLAGFIAEESPLKVTEGRGSTLPMATKKAIDLVDNKKGFFLMVEGSQIDWGGHANDTDYIINEMIDFDKAIAIALDYAEKDKETLVIITADHECGGFTINGGNMQEGKVEGMFTTKGHTAVMVPVFAYGPGAEQFMGIYDNTEIYYRMMGLLGLK